ncbi:MAG TPA: hypothetical protein VFL95_06510, partial [Gemmatimonadales bacterium]|nr:hypothetical protein [Gemmatimonadales bacterium]
MQSKRSAVPCVLFLLTALCRPAGGMAQTALAPDSAAERSRLIRELDSVAQAVTVHSDSAPLWLLLGQVRLALARRHAIAREGPLQPVG